MPMSATSFDSRSSEWMGDLTVWLRQKASANGEQLDRLRRARERLYRCLRYSF